MVGEEREKEIGGGKEKKRTNLEHLN